MEDGPSFRVTRRQFVGRGSAVAGALGLVSLGWPAGRLAAAPSTQSGLTPARAATYLALLQALALAPEAGVADVAQGQRALEAWYGSAPASTRTYIDSVLDALESDTPRSFKGMSAQARLKHLRGRMAQGEDELAPAALVLAAPVVDPDTDTPAVSLSYLQP
jgi:hypothetical protein